MNDLEQELRTLLDEKASHAGAPMSDARLLRRARRRQVGTALAGLALLTIAVMGIVVGLRTLASDRKTPAEPSALVDTTVNGITITHPKGWSVVDPVQAGIAPETETLTRLVLLMTNAEDATAEAISCPGLAGDANDGVGMTIQERPVALAGEGSAPWPVELVPLGEPGEAVGPSGCFPGWTFRRGSWTAHGRSFEARVGFGPDITPEERGALEAAFASLRFDRLDAEPEAAVIATGTTAGEDWELIAQRSPDGLVLSLEWSSGGSGFGVSGIPASLSYDVRALGQGADRELIVYGSARSPIVRVEYEPANGGPAVSAPVIDVPDQIDARVDAFVLVYPGPGDREGQLRGLDADDRVVATVATRPPPAEVEAPDGEPDEVLFRGRTNECFWILERWSEGPDRERLQLLSREGAPLVDLVLDTGSGAPPLQLASFDCPTDDSDAVLVFGVATDDAVDVRWTDPPGSDGGPPECVDSTLPSRFCVVLDDFNGPGEAIAFDAQGTEIWREPYG